MDALGYPLRFILTGGQASDSLVAMPLLEGFSFQFALADRGYDADEILQTIQKREAIAVIPPKCNRKIQRHYNRDIYKERNLIERFFNRIKHFRRVATRYEKTACNYLAMLTLASIVLWLA